MGSLNASLRQHWEFFRLYFRARKLIGSLIPSSRALARAVLDEAGVADAPVVVEFGPGTGAFTQAILKRIRRDATLLAFEIMPEFIAILQQRFDDPRLQVIQRSAAELDQELDQRGIGQLQSVVCALPFNAFPPQLTRDILTSARERLDPQGRLVLIQQTPFKLKLIREVFPRVRIARYVLLNVPPTFVIVCQR